MNFKQAAAYIARKYNMSIIDAQDHLKYVLELPKHKGDEITIQQIEEREQYLLSLIE